MPDPSIALRRIQRTKGMFVFAKIDAVVGTPSYPAATDAVQTFSFELGIPESRTFPTPETFEDAYDAQGWLSAGYGIGSGSADIPIKPGAYPDLNGLPFLKCAYGSFVANTPVDGYTFNIRTVPDAEIEMTIARKMDQLCQWWFRCKVEGYDLPVQATADTKGIFSRVFKLKCLKYAQAGITGVKVQVGLGDAVAQVYDSSSFMTGAQFKFESDATVYTVTDVDHALNTIDFTPVAAQIEAVDKLVSGYLPTPTPPATNYIYMGRGIEQEDTGSGLVDTALLEGTLSLNHAINEYYEVLETEFPTELLRQDLDIKFSPKRFLRTQNLGELQWPARQRQIAIQIIAGQVTDAYYATINMPNCQATKSKDSAEPDGARYDMEYQALMSAAAGDSIVEVIQCT